jgi:hypothetical protein
MGEVLEFPASRGDLLRLRGQIEDLSHDYYQACLSSRLGKITLVDCRGLYARISEEAKESGLSDVSISKAIDKAHARVEAYFKSN